MSGEGISATLSGLLDRWELFFLQFYNEALEVVDKQYFFEVAANVNDGKIV